jgi:hypothetical protein
MATDGDPRVLFVMNTALSAAFSAILVWVLSVLDLLAFAWETVALAGVVLTMITYLIVLR